MRTLVIAFTILACVFTKSSAASDGIVTPEQVLKSFQSKFAAAKNADWTLSEDIYKVNFALDGQHITAFYTPDGAMAAITRNISSFQLPVSLQTTLKNEYKDYWVSELFELSNDDGVQYYVTLEDADTKLILKSSSTAWTTYQKQRKN